jgi:hypothetical protein
MGIQLIVERITGRISVDECKQTVARHSDLRIRQEPYQLVAAARTHAASHRPKPKTP